MQEHAEQRSLKDAQRVRLTAEHSRAEHALEQIRAATSGTDLDGRIYLVGGALRDEFLRVPHGADLDLVLEGDAVALAKQLFDVGLSSHYPVLYPRFGTAMIHILTPDASVGGGVDVELVTARSESYHPDSRKPEVQAGSLREDIFRRDFTINTLARNLHSGELLDLTGLAISDIRAGLIRTPVEPRVTFFDDPLRMLRAVRFASRFNFTIEDQTWESICAEAERLRPPTIALERIREEFNKVALLPGKRFRAGMDLLLHSGLLERFLPEMLPMQGCTQGAWHAHDVWDHTLTALESLPDDAPLELRLALLWHDVGKPYTRTEDDRGVHFFGHPAVGAELTRVMMNRLKYSNDEIRDTVAMVKLHMRLGDYREQWDDPAVRRLIRDIHPWMDGLFSLTECDRSAVDIPEGISCDLPSIRARMDALMSAVTIDSPLDGRQIMQILETGEGPHLRDAKEYLVNEVIDGRLGRDDTSAAEQMIVAWWKSKLENRE